MLFGIEPNAKWASLSKHWDRSSPPVFVLLAGRFVRDAVATLDEMFLERSKLWRFDHGVWKWTGTEIEKISEGVCPQSAPEDYDRCHIPKQVPHSPPRTKSSLEDIQQIALSAGVGKLFAFAISEADRLGLKVKPGSHSVTLQTIVPSGKLESYMSIEPTQKACPDPSHGLNVSYHEPTVRGMNIPGREETENQPGYFMSNRMLSSEEQITQMFELYTTKFRQ